LSEWAGSQVDLTRKVPVEVEAAGFAAAAEVVLAAESYLAD